MPILYQLVLSRYRTTGYNIMNLAGICMTTIMNNELGKTTDARHM